jgi:hypothetical protein
MAPWSPSGAAPLPESGPVPGFAPGDFSVSTPHPVSAPAHWIGHEEAIGGVTDADLAPAIGPNSRIAAWRLYAERLSRKLKDPGSV